MSLIILVLPIFLIVFLGKILQLTLVTNSEIWDGINKIAYWVLFPAFLFTQISAVDLGSPHLATYSAALIAGYFAAIAFVFAVGKAVGTSLPALTSILQGASRHNTFLGLAVASAVFSASGAAIGTIATATLVPLSNVLAVVMLAAILNRQAGKMGVLREIVRNPIIIAIVTGFAFNAAGLDKSFILYQFTSTLGRASLPILLLVIGANLHFGGLHQHVASSLIAVMAKMVVFPLATFLASRAFGLPADMTVIAVIFAACPTSPASYTLARQMGGDGPLMATIISVQTALAVIVIPLAIALAQAAG